MKKLFLAFALILVHCGPVLAGEWVYAKSEDPMDDTITSSAILKSTGVGEHNYSLLVLQCKSGTPVFLMVKFGEKLRGMSKRDTEYVRQRMDKGEVERKDWLILRQENIISPYDSKALIESLSNIKTFTVAVDNSDGDEAIAQFEIAGIQAAAQKLIKDCGTKD